MALTMEAIERKMAELRALAAKYAKARAETEYLSQFRKSKLAILMKAYEMKDPDKFKTNAAQDREARADTAYLEVLVGLKEATETSEKALWELRIAQMGAELLRTQQASERAERKGYGA